MNASTNKMYKMQYYQITHICIVFPIQYGENI